MLASEMQQNKGKGKLYLQCLVLKESAICLADDKKEGQVYENISGLAVTVG